MSTILPTSLILSLLPIFSSCSFGIAIIVTPDSLQFQFPEICQSVFGFSYYALFCLLTHLEFFAIASRTCYVLGIRNWARWKFSKCVSSARNYTEFKGCTCFSEFVFFITFSGSLWISLLSFPLSSYLHGLCHPSPLTGFLTSLSVKIHCYCPGVSFPCSHPVEDMSHL